MPLSFLNPALLLGTLASALPVIIHFLSRRKVHRRPFSDLRFLTEVQTRQSRSLGLRRWLLLLLRVLAILLIALAAAGPRWGGLGAGSGDRSILFVVDTSASMTTASDQGTRLDEGLRICEQMITALPDEAAVQVITAGGRTQTLFGDWLPAGAGVVGLLSEVTATEGAFKLEEVLDLAARQVARAPGSPVEVVFISDLQDLTPDPDWIASAERLNAAGRTRWLVRQVGTETPGGGVLDIRLPGRALQPGESIILEVAVLPEFEDQVFLLELDGATVAEAVAAAPDGSVQALEFSLTVPGPGWHQGRIWKESDGFAADDSRPFVLRVPESIDVLVVHGPDRPVDPVGGRGGWRYLTEALAPGGVALIQPTVLTSAEWNSGSLVGRETLVLVNPDPVGRRVLDGWLSWMESGGSTVLMVGEPTLTDYLARTVLPAVGLPGEAETVNASDAPRKVRVIARDHPVFMGLGSEAIGTFEDIEWRRWLRLPEGESRVLLSETGGDPLFLEIPVGQGRLVILPWDLHPGGSDLAGNPMVVPFFQRLVGWLAGSGPEAASFNGLVGRELVLAPESIGKEVDLDRIEEIRLLETSRDRTRPVELAWNQGRPWLIGGVPDRAGIQVFLAGPDTLGLVALAIPPEESTLGLESPEKRLNQLSGLELETSGDLSRKEPTRFMASLVGRDLAPWLLALACLLLAVELGLGRGIRSAPV